MSRRLRSLALACVSLLVAVGIVAWQARQDVDAADPADPAKPAPPPIPYWKGNLHTHSFWSDGDDFPEMIADWYKQHGYHFLALSDHNVLAEGEKWIDAGLDDPKRAPAVEKYLARFGRHWVEQRKYKNKSQVRLKPLSEFRSMLEEPGKFLLIPAEEVTGKFGKYPVHLNAINLRDVIPPTQGDSASETVRVNLRAVAAQQKKTGRTMLGFVNHPNFHWGLKAEDLLAAEELRFFEIFNGHPGVRNYGDALHPSTERMWDITLAVRLGKLGLPMVYGLATDDAHGYHAFGIGKVNPGRGWVMVRSPYLTAGAMVRAMEAGQFYCSTGVTLANIQREGNDFTVVVRPEEGVTYRTQFVATMKDASFDSEPRLDSKGAPADASRVYSIDIGKVVAETEGATATYRLTGKELYVRAKVISTKPHPNPFSKGDVEVAWTQPVTP